MEENAYQSLADAVFRRIEAAIDEVDAEVVDCDRAGDVVTMTFANKVKCIVNTQRPTRQIWVAARDRAWHFSYDGTRWVDDRDAAELFATLARVVKEQAGVDVAFG
jgi:CyaY protein